MAEQTKTSFGMKLLMLFSFVCLAFGAYKFTKSFVGKGENQTGEKKNTSEIFCGKEFTSEDYQKELDMQKKYLTVLNCDGSYKSELNWNAYSSSGEETYNNTIGVSKGNFKSFSGNWEIVTENIPEYITQQITEYENFEPNHMPKNQTIIIKYRSSGGRNGYAYIYTSTDKNETILTPVPSAAEVSSSYKDDDLQMYFGKIQN